LPTTVNELTAENGVKVYLVGTAHFSRESQADVIKTIRSVKPNVVMVELCQNRASILSLDEELLMKEASNITFQKISHSVKENGLVQGLLQILLLNLSAHITKQLGMAPGGEFRAAFKEVKTLPGCKIQLGDRPIAVTLQRALGALNWFQRLKLAWCLITSSGSISPEDVEKCKQKDMLEEVLQEMTGEFPALSRVFVQERDIYLAHSLKMASLLSMQDFNKHQNNHSAPTVVGVVGIGHCPGIINVWGTDHNVASLLIIPPPTMVGRFLKLFIRVTFFGCLGYSFYRIARFTHGFIVSNYSYIYHI
ncbi:hypothetical protein HELRODRAFT_66410, partial [Helobdella robusta]